MVSGYPEYLKNLLEDIQTSGDFADVTLVCDDHQQIRAHRNILSACSPVFKNILRISASNPHSIVYLRGIHHEELLSILHFVYLGQVTFSEGRMEEFLSVAKDLEIKELTQKMGQRECNLLQDIQEADLEVEETSLRVEQNSEDSGQNLEIVPLDTGILLQQKPSQDIVGTRKSIGEYRRDRTMLLKQQKDQELNAPWIRKLLDNFKGQVIDPLSYRTRVAVKMNERIEDQKIKKEGSLKIGERLV